MARANVEGATREDSSMRAITAAEVRRSFVNLSQTQAKSLTLPAWWDLIDFDQWDYIGWRDAKAPQRGYIVAIENDLVTSIVVRAPEGASTRHGSSLCDLCHTGHAAADVALFTAARAGAAGRKGDTVGLYICADLACSLYIRGLREVKLPQGETVSVEVRSARLQERLSTFLARVLS
jgi:hypothetical protein